MRDFIPVHPGSYEPRAEWLLTREQRELALAKRHLAKGAELTRGTRDHLPLEPGTNVLVQNQVGPSKKKWDKSGVVLADKGKSQYQVKLDGSGRITLRNRAFLKRMVPFQGRQEGPLRQDLVLQRETGRSSSPRPTGFEHPAQVQVEAEESEIQPGSESLETAQEGVQLGVRCPAGGEVRRSTRQVLRPAKYSK